jgi:hypothetical protein
MKLVLTIAAALAVSAAAPPASSLPDAADDLAWMAGSWVSEGDSDWTEERWSRPRGGMMLGTALTGKGAAANHYEFMRIAPDEAGRLTFWASPRGTTPEPFPAAGGGEGEIVFVNPAHDYPQRIVYRREGAELVATISLADGSKPQSWRYRRRMARR